MSKLLTWLANILLQFAYILTDESFAVVHLGATLNTLNRVHCNHPIDCSVLSPEKAWHYDVTENWDDE